MECEYKNINSNSISNLPQLSSQQTTHHGYMTMEEPIQQSHQLIPTQSTKLIPPSQSQFQSEFTIHHENKITITPSQSKDIQHQKSDTMKLSEWKDDDNDNIDNKKKPRSIHFHEKKIHEKKKIAKPTEEKDIIIIDLDD